MNIADFLLGIVTGFFCFLIPSAAVSWHMYRNPQKLVRYTFRRGVGTVKPKRVSLVCRLQQYK